MLQDTYVEPYGPVPGPGEVLGSGIGYYSSEAELRRALPLGALDFLIDEKIIGRYPNMIVHCLDSPLPLATSREETDQVVQDLEIFQTMSVSELSRLLGHTAVEE